MKSISRLWNAFATLATSLEGLAALVDSIAGQLRQRLQGELEQEPVPAQLPAPGDNPTVDGASRRRTRTAS